MIRNISSMHQDFVITHLNSQIDQLNMLLGLFRDKGAWDYDYVQKSLKNIENNIRGLRKLFVKH